MNAFLTDFSAYLNDVKPRTPSNNHGLILVGDFNAPAYNTVRYYGVSLWNFLPHAIKNTILLNVFKAEIQQTLIILIIIVMVSVCCSLSIRSYVVKVLAFIWLIYLY